MGQCYRCYRLDSGSVVQRDSGTVGQLYSVAKKSSELAKPHSYWVLLILVAVSRYAVKFQRSMFTRYQRSTFYWTINRCTLVWVNTRKSLKYKGFLAIRSTERSFRCTIYIYIIFLRMLRCYSATLAYVRDPLKNRKYITCKIYLYICGDWASFWCVYSIACVAPRAQTAWKPLWHKDFHSFWGRK